MFNSGLPVTSGAFDLEGDLPTGGTTPLNKFNFNDPFAGCFREISARTTC